MRRALARIDLGAVERNARRLARAAAPARLCAVVKADGYGHGVREVAGAALRGGATWLAVATAGEAQALAPFTVPKLVLGALSPDERREATAAGADVVAWSRECVAALAPGTGVHVKLDSGMGRLGTRDPGEALGVAEAVLARGDLRLAGAMTHFATADDDPGFVREQLDAFAPWAARVRELAPDVLVHAANSAATLQVPGSRYDLVRCGIALYGLDPFQRDPAAHGLEPALALTSYVADVKRCAPGQSAGYGRRFVATRETWLATIPIGYGDGARRGLTNNADVLIGGRRYPLVGTVSMDNITVDLGPGEPPPSGAEAVLIGRQGPERILAEEVARRLETINYEVTCGITSRVPRVPREP